KPRNATDSPACRASIIACKHWVSTASVWAFERATVVATWSTGSALVIDISFMGGGGIVAGPPATRRRTGRAYLAREVVSSLLLDRGRQHAALASVSRWSPPAPGRGRRGSWRDAGRDAAPAWRRRDCGSSKASAPKPTTFPHRSTAGSPKALTRRICRRRRHSWRRWRE